MEAAKTPPKEKKGLKSVWVMFKDIFKSKPTSAQPSTTATPTPTTSVPPERGRGEEQGQEATVTPEQEHPPQPFSALEADNQTASVTYEVDPSQDPQTDSSVTGGYSQQEALMRSSRVGAAFARHDLEVDDTEWDRRPKVPHERVHRNIRLRVRYTCHNCSTTFGRDRVCIGCQHRRCTRCARYPPKKERLKVSHDILDDTLPQPQTDTPRPTVGGGTCHECQTDFEIDVEECPNCHHKICERCTHQASITVEPSLDAPSQSAQEAASEKDSEQTRTTRDESTAVS